MSVAAMEAYWSEYALPCGRSDARYPIVHGHIADDRLMRIIDDYENGDLTIEEVEHKLAVAPFRAFQYSFHTDEALSYLHYEGVES